MDIKHYGRKLKRFWSQKSHYDKFVFASSVVFLGVVAFFIILHRVFFTPDQFYVAGFMVALLTGQAGMFLRDWTPVILLILSYEYLRGLIPLLNHTVHFHLMPEFDMLLFGRIPASFLQQHLYTSGRLHLYDYGSAIIYLMHFVVPMLVAFAFWLKDRDFFKKYVVGMISLSYLTFLTYLAFPAAPPWMASEQGVIPSVQHITNIIVSHLFNYVQIPTVYRYFGANLTAAVPSLHAAYPLLTALFLGKKYPKLRPVLVLIRLGCLVCCHVFGRTLLL